MQTKEVLLSGDFRYAYRRFGDPEAPAIILLMGLGMSMDAWPESLISGLLAEGFQVITPDNRDSYADIHIVCSREPSDRVRSFASYCNAT